jgi:hypothetical protein
MDHTTSSFLSDTIIIQQSRLSNMNIPSSLRKTLSEVLS